MKTQKLPQTDSIQELAKFWDTHDLTDFEEQLEEVTEPVFERQVDTELKIHLHPKEAETVKRIAESKGVVQEAERSNALGGELSWHIGIVIFP